MFHMSPSFGASGRLCFVMVTFPGYLQLHVNVYVTVQLPPKSSVIILVTLCLDMCLNLVKIISKYSSLFPVCFLKKKKSL